MVSIGKIRINDPNNYKSVKDWGVCAVDFLNVSVFATQNTIKIQRATTMHVSEGYFKQITVKVKKKS